ncbi:MULTISPECIES: hypothetical protein [unclassified Streptomyces]|nr:MULTISPECIES: hypothetical protein [unclassified Streptomyces]
MSPLEEIAARQAELDQLAESLTVVGRSVSKVPHRSEAADAADR